MTNEQSQENRGNGGLTEQERQRPGAEELQDRVAEIDSWLRTFVRKRPFATVIAAVAAGFVLGRLLRK